MGGVEEENPFETQFAQELNESCSKLFDVLAKLPRITREAFYVIVDRMEQEGTHLFVRDELIKRVINIPLKRYYEELSLLEESLLLRVDDEEMYKYVIHIGKVSTENDILCFIVEACNYYRLPLKEILVDLNFSHLEES